MFVDVCGNGWGDKLRKLPGWMGMDSSWLTAHHGYPVSLSSSKSNRVFQKCSTEVSWAFQTTSRITEDRWGDRKTLSLQSPVTHRSPEFLRHSRWIWSFRPKSPRKAAWLASGNPVFHHLSTSFKNTTTLSEKRSCDSDSRRFLSPAIWWRTSVLSRLRSPCISLHLSDLPCISTHRRIHEIWQAPPVRHFFLPYVCRVCCYVMLRYATFERYGFNMIWCCWGFGYLLCLFWAWWCRPWGLKLASSTISMELRGETSQ